MKKEDVKYEKAVCGIGTWNFREKRGVDIGKVGCDVVAVDNSLEKVQDISDSVAYAMRADVADPEALQELGARNLDAVVVAVSDSLEASIMAHDHFQENVDPYVMAKAKDERHGAVLEKVVDCIVYPERDTGTRVAKSLVSSTFTDWIELSSEYSLTEAHAGTIGSQDRCQSCGCGRNTASM